MRTPQVMEMGSEAPLYQRIAQELRHNIMDGVYKAGERVPTEEALSVRFGVNRHTLRRAISLLASEGLLRVDQGRGTFVADIAPLAAIKYPIGERVRFSQSLREQGIEPAYQKLRAIEVPASRTIAENLEIKNGEHVALIERLGLADGKPLKLAASYFPLSRFPDILSRMEEYGSISRLFSDVYKCDHRRKRTIITAQIVTPEEARLLGVAYNSPVLVTEALNVDENDEVIEYGVTRFRSDRTELVIQSDLE